MEGHFISNLVISGSVLVLYDNACLLVPVETTSRFDDLMIYNFTSSLLFPTSERVLHSLSLSLEQTHAELRTSDFGPRVVSNVSVGISLPLSLVQPHAELRATRFERVILSLSGNLNRTGTRRTCPPWRRAGRSAPGQSCALRSPPRS